MRKQGIWVTRFVTAALFLFVVAYMGYHVADALYDPITRADAVLQEVEEVIPLDGLFVREETVLPKPSGIIEQAVGEGERVGRGQAVAYAYTSSGARTGSARYNELKRRLDQLLSMQERGGIYTETSALDAQISQKLYDTLYGASRGRFASLDTSGLKTLIFDREYAHRSDVDFAPVIAGLEAEMASLSASLETAVSTVRAEEPGAFSSVVDGYESILTPELLVNWLPSEYDALLKREDIHPDADAFGKLITGFTWYYEAVANSEEAAKLRKGATVTLRFVGDLARTIPMRILEIGPQEEGRCMVTFSTQLNVSDFIDMRRVSADIIHKTYEGVRIPREAVRLRDGVPGVYVTVANTANWKSIDIIYEGDTFYLIRYKADNKNAVLPGDEIIVTARDLYDGKIL